MSWVFSCWIPHSHVWHASFIRVTWSNPIQPSPSVHTPCHDSLVCVTWLIDMCDIPLSYVWHDSLIRVPWQIHVYAKMRSYVWHDAIRCVTWLTHVCDMTHWYVRHTSCIRVTWLIHTCANKFMCVLWCVHMCDTTHSDVWRDSMICATYVHTSDMTHPSMRSHMTHSSVLYAALMSLHWSVYMFATPPPCRLSSVRYTHQSELSLQGGKHVDWSDWTAQSTGWRTCIGCLKLQVSFRKRAINHRALLLEMTCKDKASCATLYPHLSSAVHSSVYTLQMTHASVMYTRVTWLIPQSGQTWLIHQSCIRVTWLMNESSLFRESCPGVYIPGLVRMGMCNTWLIHQSCMTDSTEIATPSNSTKSRNSNFSVKIRIMPKSQFEFVPQDTEKSESLGSMDFGDAACSVETVIHEFRDSFIMSHMKMNKSCHSYTWLTNESCVIDEWVMCDWSCHTCEWVMSHICARNV